jgi:hypothetical protein
MPMAKQVTLKAVTTAPPESFKRTTVTSYRAERLSTYEYQGYKITRRPDGSYSEELFGKPTLLNLLARKFFEAMDKETNEVFQANKKLLK